MAVTTREPTHEEVEKARDVFEGFAELLWLQDVGRYDPKGSGRFDLSKQDYTYGFAAPYQLNILTELAQTAGEEIPGVDSLREVLERVLARQLAEYNLGLRWDHVWDDAGSIDLIRFHAKD